jgi:hypothetical protein
MLHDLPSHTWTELPCSTGQGIQIMKIICLQHITNKCTISLIHNCIQKISYMFWCLNHHWGIETCWSCFGYYQVLNVLCICWLYVVNTCKMHGTHSFKIMKIIICTFCFFWLPPPKFVYSSEHPVCRHHPSYFLHLIRSLSEFTYSYEMLSTMMVFR